MPKPSENLSDYEIVPQHELEDLHQTLNRLLEQKGLQHKGEPIQFERVAQWSLQAKKGLSLLLSSLAKIYQGFQASNPETHARKGISRLNIALREFPSEDGYSYQLKLKEPEYEWVRKKRKRE